MCTTLSCFKWIFSDIFAKTVLNRPINVVFLNTQSWLFFEFRIYWECIENLSQDKTTVFSQKSQKDHFFTHLSTNAFIYNEFTKNFLMAIKCPFHDMKGIKSYEIKLNCLSTRVTLKLLSRCIFMLLRCIILACEIVLLRLLSFETSFRLTQSVM